MIARTVSRGQANPTKLSGGPVGRKTCQYPTAGAPQPAVGGFRPRAGPKPRLLPFPPYRRIEVAAHYPAR
jgi:hypothetical protein